MTSLGRVIVGSAVLVILLIIIVDVIMASWKGMGKDCEKDVDYLPHWIVDGFVVVPKVILEKELKQIYKSKHSQIKIKSTLKNIYSISKQRGQKSIQSEK